MRTFVSARVGVLCVTLAACSGSSTHLSPDAGVDDAGPGSSDAGGGKGDGGDMDAGEQDGGGDATTSDAGSSSDAQIVFTTNDAGQVLCGTSPCACHDGMDNDDDGLVDGFDPECTGPYDNDEGSFATGIPGDNKDPWQDCFFDGNSGNGEGDCMIPTVCILDRESEECASSLPGSRTLEAEEMKCEGFCEARTPNGCDCFGCCTVQVSDTEIANVLLDPACEVELDADGRGVVGDGCQSCTVSPVCGNECGRCELCFGKTVEDLPDDCGTAPPADAGTPDGGSPADGGTGEPTYECVDGAGNPQDTCSAESPCTKGYFCSNGCCTSIVI